jgi:restriction endonuclease S subunit
MAVFILSITLLLEKEGKDYDFIFFPLFNIQEKLGNLLSKVDEKIHERKRQKGRRRRKRWEGEI